MEMLNFSQDEADCFQKKPFEILLLHAENSSVLHYILFFRLPTLQLMESMKKALMRYVGSFMIMVDRSTWTELT
jgi:hypothetical protein